MFLFLCIDCEHRIYNIGSNIEEPSRKLDSVLMSFPSPLRLRVAGFDLRFTLTCLFTFTTCSSLSNHLCRDITRVQLSRLCQTLCVFSSFSVIFLTLFSPCFRIPACHVQLCLVITPVSGNQPAAAARHCSPRLTPTFLCLHCSPLWPCLRNLFELCSVSGCICTLGPHSSSLNRLAPFK